MTQAASSFAPPPDLACLARMRFTSPEAMRDFAARIAPDLGAGDTLLLAGDLGSGKTHFARSIIQTRLAEVDRMEDVPSPSFTLVQTYEAGDLEIWHCDLYRLGGPDEVLELGLDLAFETALCLVEWPDRLADLAPPQAAWLVFEVPPGLDSARDLSIHATPGSTLAAKLAPGPARP